MGNAQFIWHSLFNNEIKLVQKYYRFTHVFNYKLFSLATIERD